MKRLIYYSIALLCSGLFSCSEPKQANDDLDVIPIEAAFANPSELKASEYFQKVRYVRLETSDSCLIGANPTVRISGDKLIVNSGRRQYYAFDKETGRFITSLGHIGNDPQGALNLDGWINDASGRIYFLAGNNKFVEYDLEGNFQGRIAYPGESEGFFGKVSFSYLNENVNVAHSPSRWGADQIIFFKDSVPIHKFDLLYESTDSLPGDASAFKAFSVFLNSATL